MLAIISKIVNILHRVVLSAQRIFRMLCALSIIDNKKVKHA